uniref:RING finger protein unkempt n=1 Tax=Anopheles quadriannulatus TaxID=34691 RepID=A0A2C9H883_ANOQN
MASTDPTKSLFTTQTEKPNHYTYLKEFRVEQCPSFLQHKCNQHRPFVCFNWHFMNQRRRRPVRRRDGSFNYSADNYCPKYDETTGICPDGDDCPFLHRTAGDTERRYHLRYYKTCMCVHDTDARGYCVKNGHHCAFAHGIHDQRPPVYDIKELEALQNVEDAGDGGLNGPNVLDKERNLMNEDPKWQDTNYVLAHYKTEQCKRPPRLCRQGYACPQYHNSKDKRRSPRKFKYRSTPCPNVKHGEEWGEPANCEAGDNCQYCHTRTEQQFHPEIYKSTKCNDVQQAGYCPRSVFCAFAHVEPYMVMEEDPQALALSDMRSSVLSSGDGGGNGSGNGGVSVGGVLAPGVIGGAGGGNVPGGPLVSAVVGSHSKKDAQDLANFSYFQLQLQNGSAESSESASTSSLGSNNSSHNKAPGSHLQQQKHGSSALLGNGHGGAGNPLGGLGLLSNGGPTGANSGSANASSLLSNLDFNPDLSKQMVAIDNDLSLNPIEREQRKRMTCLTFNMFNVGSPLEMYEQARRDNMHGFENSMSGLMSSGLLPSSSAPVNIPGSSMGNSISGILQGTSAPVNIPGSSLGHNFSPSSHSNLFGLHDPFGTHHIGSGSAPKLSNNSYGHNHTDNFFFHSNNIISPVLGDGLSASPEIRRMSDLNPLSSEISSNTTNLLFGDGQHHQGGPQAQTPSQQQQQHHLHHQSQQSQQTPSQQQQQQAQQVPQQQQQQQQQQAINWEERVLQATTACEAWKAQMEESNRKTAIAEQQRDEALSHVKALTEKLEQMKMSGNNGCPPNYRPCDLRGMPLAKLKSIQAKLREEIEEVEIVLYQETANKCMKCEEKNRSVTLVPCNHYVVCDTCATTQRECPYCQTPVTPKA